MTPWLRLLFVLVAGLPLCLASGCNSVSRRLTIRSDPPGALVEVNGRRLGNAPVSMDFTYYGVNEITLSRPGFETLTVQQPVPAPWYQVFPLDLVSDNFLPWRITNRHDFTYRLSPLPAIGAPGDANNEELLQDRGQNFRSQSRFGN
jgi:hypothetical protein